MIEVTIKAKDEAEAAAIERAMNDTETRAAVVALGILLDLKTDRARHRVLKYLIDKLDENHLQKKQANAEGGGSLARLTLSGP